MSARIAGVAEDVRVALRAPVVPSPIARLVEVAPGYLDVVWPRVASSVDTTGFLGSALYLADMALTEVEAVYEPVMTREALREASVSDDEVASLLGVVDYYHYGRPQLLLHLRPATERDVLGSKYRVRRHKVEPQAALRDGHSSQHGGGCVPRSSCPGRLRKMG